MLKKRFSPILKLKSSSTENSENFLTVIKLDNVLKVAREYLPQVKSLVDNETDIIRLVAEALILYYCWNKDFIDVGIKNLPKEEDLNTTEEIAARETLIECIIKSMHLIDAFHPEFRTLCVNVASVSILNVCNVFVLLSVTMSSGIKH